MNDDPSTTLTIVGIAPPGFRGPRTNDEHDIWISWEGWPDILLPPLESDDSISEMFPLEVVLRARPNVDAAGMAGALARLIELAEQPAKEGARLVAYPGPSTDSASYSGQARRSSMLATLGILLVMLACSAIVALESMLLARTRIDSATRMALGEPAGVRWRRLGRALLANGLPPVLAAAAVSWLVVMWIRSSAHGELAATVLRLAPLQVTFWIAGIAAASFCTVAVVMSAVGLFSMTSTSSPEFSRVRQVASRPIRSPFLVAAAGSFMAVALAIAAWMELDTQLSRSLGFRTEGIQYSLIVPSGDVSSAFERLHSQRSIDPLKQALDGVLDTEVVLASGLPLGVSLVAELMDGSGSNGPRFFFNEVTPGYFRIFGIPLLTGRLPGNSAAEAVVTPSFARRFLPEVEAVGQQLHFRSASGRSETVQIVGVVADAHRVDAKSPQTGMLYRPLHSESGLWVGVATEAHAARLHTAISAFVGASDASSWRVTGPAPFSERIRSAYAAELAEAKALGVVALALVLLGFFTMLGLVRSLLRSRAKEMAVRRALGAPGWRLAAEATGLRILPSVLGSIGMAVLAAVMVRASTVDLNEKQLLMALLAGFVCLLCSCAIVLASALHSAIERQIMDALKTEG